jgi:hypothetical protein
VSKPLRGPRCTQKHNRPSKAAIVRTGSIGKATARIEVGVAVIRYRLDDLGWYQFEWLVQAVLKDQLGIGVESWGGHGDYGRDAWCQNPLHFPAKQSKTNGPFLFQAKFVESANAAGAKPFPRLIAAVQAEMTRTSRRRSKNRATECRQYVLLTNALISPSDRQRIAAAIEKALPNVTTHCLGGSDICDLLDSNPTLKRSFPQLLSLQDLDILLANVINRDVVERSSAAISYARTISAVFVPTSAYAQSWEVLRRHHFAVLEGPQEMGKSAIAWMVALAQIANSWEAVVCDNPEDFFRVLRPDVPQIFIADDAFGRTEYDPSRGAKWEAQLHRVFSRLGDKHWLIWTSRKHILERARRHMDVQGPAHAFPRPGEVLVDAGGLTVREKALILYRHSKHTLADISMRAFVKCHAIQIVSDEAFTPERIRRFVAEVVPQLVVETHSDPEILAAKIRQEIQNPTDRMRKSFHALSLAHKWMLLALLESDHYCTTEELLRRYQSQYSDSGAKAHEDLEELTEAFVTIKGTTHRYVEWIHPSYRDLVIEQLRDGGSLKSEFLTRMNVAGIKLALSDTGGSTGRVRFPLISSARDWDVLRERTMDVANTSGIEQCAELLTALANAMDGAVGQERSSLLDILKKTCQIVRHNWDSEQVELSSSAINAYSNASEHTSPLVPMPALEPTWRAALSRLQAQVADPDGDFLFWPAPLDDFLAIIEAIENSEPRLLRRIGFPRNLDADFRALLTKINDELDVDRTYRERESYDGEADASFGLATSLDRLREVVPEIQEASGSTINRLKLNANRCRERYKELDEQQDGDDSTDHEQYHVSSHDSFDINSVVLDL